MTISTSILVLLASMVTISIAADLFVRSGTRISKSLGVSEFLIGLFFAAIGTSLPELASSIIASSTGHPEVALGNVIGSNIANVGLILGICCVLQPINVRVTESSLDTAIMVTTAVLLWVFSFDGAVDFWEAWLLIIIYGSYFRFKYIELKMEHPAKYLEFVKFVLTVGFSRPATVADERGQSPSSKGGPAMTKSIALQCVYAVLSLALLWVSSKYLIESVVFMATQLAVPESLIGLTVVAIGTSLPELVVTLAALRRNKSGLIVGNIIGSNIANIALVLGATGVISVTNVGKENLILTIPVMLAFTFAFHIMLRTKMVLGRRFGAVLLMVYLMFNMTLILNNMS